MITINFSNVEKLIFEDGDLQRLLPSHMAGHFEQWKLSKHLPMLRQLGKQSLLDVLNELDDYTSLLNEYFNDEVSVEKLSYHACWNVKVPVDDEERLHEEMRGVSAKSYMTSWRDEEFLYLTIWR